MTGPRPLAAPSIPNDRIDRYLRETVARIEGELRHPPRSVVLVGSLASGDFHPASSDLDLIVVARTRLTPEEKAGLSAVLRHGVHPCPAHGLDLIVYADEAIVEAVREPRYEYSLATGAAWTDEISPGGPYPGGLIDLAAARSFGRPLRGPHPGTVFGAIPDGWIQRSSGVPWNGIGSGSTTRSTTRGVPTRC